MKTLIAIALLLPTFSFAQVTERTFEALVRNDNERPEVDQVVLSDLVSNDSFDGEHFKIVKGKSDEAIKFDEERAITFRAATAYYHLTIARNYFVNKLKSEHVAKLPKMTIRIDHFNQFTPLGPFMNDNREPQYNNALTIPAGKSFRGDKEWGIEIWFRPAKKIHLRDLKTNNLQAQEFKVLMGNFRKQTHMQSLQNFLLMAVRVGLNESSGMELRQEDVVRLVGSSLIMEAGYQFLDPITKVFTRKWYWLDTALIPEIIYHEFSHVALSDHLGLDASTSNVEGMADYFAGQIADSPKLAMKIKKYNTYNGKNAEKKQEYKIQLEQPEYANTDFMFGLLWAMGDIVGEEQEEEFMFELRKKLKPSDQIRKEFVEALLQNCDELCAQPFVYKLRMLKALNLKGL